MSLWNEYDVLVSYSSNFIDEMLRQFRLNYQEFGEGYFRIEERRLITLNNPEKGSNPRIWKISTRLTGMLGALPKWNIYIFGNPNTRAIRASYCNTRKSLSQKLQNPRLLRIRLHTFRHWKATTLYHQTKIYSS